MKTKLFPLFLAVAMLFALTGCSLDAAEDRIENVIDTVATPETVLTEDEAVTIALEHAGLIREDISNLRVQYEIDDRVPEYEIEFRQGRAEYDYTIQAETGEILSFDVGD